MSRVFRCLVCLLVICCFLINLFPIKAEATSAGIVATFASAGAVTVSAPVAIAAGLIALGIMVGTNDDFQRVVDNAVSSLGDWIKDGTVELLQTIDSAGKKAYYVAGDMLEDLRSLCISQEVVKPNELILDDFLYPPSDAISVAEAAPYSCLVYYNFNNGPITYHLVYSYDSPFIVSAPYANNMGISIYPSVSSATWYSFDSSSQDWSSGTGAVLSGNKFYKIISSQEFGVLSAKFSTSYDLNLGQVSSVPVDGSSARQWSEEYTDRGLYVVEGSGGGSPPEGDDDNNNGKWYWPVVLAGAAGVAALTQQDQWTGETPQEFDDYRTQTEFEILSRPEVEFGQGLELAPVTSPAPDTGGDSGEDTDPTTGEDTDPGTGTNPDTGTDTNPDTGNDSWSPSGDMQHFTLDLKEYFPFCIPFDLYDFFTCLNADPVAPVIEWVIPLPGGDTYPLELDLSTFDPVAQLLRRLQLLLFCVGLAFKTRDLIKG